MKKYLLMYLSIFSVLFVSNQFVYAEDSEVSVFDVEQNMELEENIVEDVTLESSVFESSLPIEEYSSAWVEGNAVPEPYGIIGSDDRYRVDTTKYPNSAVVRLGFSNGIRDYAGTGFLVSPDTVVTAAHCVYSNGRWTINGLKIQPGYDSGYLPFGQTSDIRSVYILKSWKSGGGAYGSKYNTKDDIAVIKLKKKIGDRTGYFGMRQAVSGNVNVTGYPGSNNATDKNKYGKMYSSFGPIVSSTSYELSYRIDTTSGHSGSPIHTPDHYTVGVHVGGGSVMNDGVRFNDEYYNFVKGIKDQYVAKQFNKNVTVTKEGTTIWGNFDWNNKKGNTTGKLGKVYKAKYVYKLDNNNSYYSLYNVDGSWAGYINSGACTEVKSQSLNKNVTITKEGLTLWENFFFSGKKEIQLES
ncbi:trypsin-like serine peptidase [Enterococcus termitis]